MKNFTLKLAAIMMAASAFVSSCSKPEFVPQTEAGPQVSVDEVGRKQEGIYVTMRGTGEGKGTDWNDAMSADDFRDLVLGGTAVEGTVFHLATGVYPLATSTVKTPLIPVSVTLKGGYREGIYTQYPDRYPTNLSGNTDWQIAKIGSGVTLTLDGVGLTGGTGTETDAALHIDGGVLKISNAVVFNNFSAYKGGAIQISQNGRLEAQSCVFRNNVADHGGVISIDSPEASCVLSDCELTGNMAEEKGGAIHAGKGTVLIEDCLFEGNASLKGSGGTFYLVDAADVDVVNTEFNGENSGNRGSLLAVEGDGVSACFDGSIMENCHSLKKSGLIHHISGSATLWFNACSISGTHTGDKYGMIADLNNDALHIAFNNCAFADACSTASGLTSQQCCWFNVGATKHFTISNSSFVGVPKSADKERPAYGLLRMNNDNVNLSVVNNIVVSTSNDGYSIYGGDSQKNLTVTGCYNCLSPVTTQVKGTFSYAPGTGDNLTLYASDFSALAWDGRTWKWENSDRTAPTADVNSAIQAADSEFYTWLSGIGALGKDIDGRDRGENSWPGSYQK